MEAFFLTADPMADAQVLRIWDATFKSWSARSDHVVARFLKFFPEIRGVA